MLQNPIYLGKITHRGIEYAGEHTAIIPQELWDKVQARLRANNVIRRNGENAKSPSLLVSLLYDDQGNRFTPSHAVKRGKRYRYYISQAVIHHRETATPGPTRIPAQEIEDVVCRRLLALVTSPEQLLEGIGEDADGATISKSLMAAGKQLAKTWQAKPTADHREFLNKVIARIIVHDDRLELVIIRFRLRDTLLSVPQNLLNDHERRAELLKKDILNLLIDMRVKRCGREVRLIVPADSDAGAPTKPVPALIKAITRVHQWPAKIVNGEFKGRHSIAQQTGIEERYAGRILNCAFLAPDIIEAILEGSQPGDLTVQRLLRALPMDWADQRKRLGFKMP